MRTKSLLPLLLLALYMTLLTTSATAAHAGSDDRQTPRRKQIARFLEMRRHFSPMCLYTFDEITDSASSLISSTISTTAVNTSLTVIDTTQGVYANHVSSGCPFGSLQFDSSLVATLNSETHAFQLGIRIAEDPAGDTKRIQLASTEFVAAEDFYTSIVTASEPTDRSGEGGHEGKDTNHSGGVTFEIVLRRHPLPQQHQHQHSETDMTLFSIANVYDGCVDSGFRVTLNADRMLVLVYYLPMEEKDKSDTCYEQLLVSSFGDTLIKEAASTCRFPEPLPNEGDNPPVYIAVTIDPASTKFIWKTEFHMQYTDPITLQTVDCRAPAVTNPPFETRLQRKSITGNLRLFIGNSPRNVSSPIVRRKPAPKRKFRPLSKEDTTINATQRLRATLTDKLMSIKGPRIPEAMRILGDKSVSVTLFGVELPPVNEDTPLAYLRGKLKDFLVKNGESMVDHLIDMLRKVQPVVEEPEQSLADKFFDHAVKYQEQLAANDSTQQSQAYPNAHSSSFDLFHFAIYRNPFTPKELDDGNWPHLGPFRPMPTLSQELHIQEDELVLVDLVQLHSVYDDVQLELRRLPEFGKLLLYPNETEVTSENLTSFRDLPTEFQKKIYFQPNVDENNENLPLPNAIALSRRRRAYSEIEFSVFKSTTGRKVNDTAVARISIFVSPVNDAPRPLATEQQVVIDGVGVPLLLDLEGKDSDGSPRLPTNRTEDRDEKKGFLDEITDALESPFATLAPPPPPKQVVKVTRLPRYGRLYDCHLATRANESLQLPLGYDKRNQLEKYRVALDDIGNRTFSTSLMYVYGGWGQESADRDRLDAGGTGGAFNATVIDELWYQLNDGEPGVYSDVAVVKFALNSSVEGQHRNANDGNCLKIVQLKEDTSITLALAEIEPLVGLLDARTKFRITELPKHGMLYQFHEAEASSNNSGNVTGNEASSARLDGDYRVGKKLDDVNRVVDDVDGKVVYIPERDYYNVLPQGDDSAPALPTSVGLDSFAFEPENLANHIELGAASQSSAESPSLPFEALQPRVIQIQVVSEPDELLLLPPMYFVANQSLGESVPTPVRFEDPDGLYEGLYHVQVKAKDGFSRFDVGADMNNDDVMRFCNFTRPCLLTRSLDKNRTAEQKKLGDDAESDDKKLLFFLEHVIYTPYYLTFLSKKKALELALSQLTFTDWKTSWLTPHRTQFTVKIRRISDSYEPLSSESSCRYYVDYPPWVTGGFKEMTEKIVHLVMNQIYEFIWTLVISVLVCVLITNASCFKSGFCCCCSRARENRRSVFEAEQARFLDRVAQNDYEYSMLLMDVADMVLEPNLAFATSLIRGLQGAEGTEHLTVLCLRSLVPVLDTERQATRFVFRLMAIEFEVNVLNDYRAELSVLQRAYLGESSCAGRALAFFCRHVGRDWLRRFMATSFDEAMQTFEPEAATTAVNTPRESKSDALFSILLGEMSLAIVDLPVEVVILCRACVKLLQTDASKLFEPSMSLFQAVHLVFFNHFIGPALLYGVEEIFGVAPDRDQRQRLVETATHFVVLAQRWDANRQCPQQQQTSGDDYVLLSEDEEKRAMRERPQLRQYEALLYTIATSPALQSSYEPSSVSQSSRTNAKSKQGHCSDIEESSSQVDCELMAMCLMSIHGILDTFLPQFEKEHKRLENLSRAPAADDEHVASLVPRLKNLLRALSFPNTSVHTLLQHGHDELNADWLCRRAALTSFSAPDWTEFAAAQQRDSDSYRHHQRSAMQQQEALDEGESEVNPRALGRSHSLLAVHIEDNTVGY
ncbi:hypothetical protein Gpo141_00002095 [Globisporangium polare]